MNGLRIALRACLTLSFSIFIVSCYEIEVKQPNFIFTGSTASCPDNQVAVVGGGVAGLAAALSLSEAGFDVVLLEAADYFGGGVKQVQPFKGFAPVDLGGEFIHGSDSIITRIAKENGWPVLPVRRSFVLIQFSLNKKGKEGGNSVLF